MKSKNVEYVIDDRIVIPDDIKNMTSKERLAEIEKIEREHLKKQKIEMIIA